MLELTPVAIMCARSISISSSLSTMFKKEFLSKLKTNYTKLRAWMFVMTLMVQKTMVT